MSSLISLDPSNNLSQFQNQNFLIKVLFKKLNIFRRGQNTKIKSESRKVNQSCFYLYKLIRHQQVLKKNIFRICSFWSCFLWVRSRHLAIPVEIEIFLVYARIFEPRSHNTNYTFYPMNFLQKIFKILINLDFVEHKSNTFGFILETSNVK